MTYAAAHGLLLAAAVAPMHGHPGAPHAGPGGDGRGVFGLDSRGPLTVTVTRVPTAGPPAAEITGALAGRAAAAGLLGGLPASARAALPRLAGFCNTPVTPPLTRGRVWAGRRYGRRPSSRAARESPGRVW